MSNYSFLEMEQFQSWKQKRGSYYNAYNAAKRKMLDQIDLVGVTKAESLESILNQIIKSQQFSESKITEQILNRLPSVIEKAGESAISKIQVTDDFKVYTEEVTAAWREYYKARDYYKMLEEKSVERIKAKEKADELYKEASKLQGQINKAQGDIFEAFLKESIPLIENKIKKIGQSEVNNLITNLEKEIKDKALITTQGAEKESIDFLFGEETIKISSQGKIDVMVDAPFISEDFPLKISAKNYNNLKEVHLLSGGKVIGLVSQWPIRGDAAKRYFLNALTVWDSPYDTLKQGRMLFGIQSLAGRGGKNEMANVFIVNNRDNKEKPITVIPIKKLLNKIDVSDDIDKVFKIKYTPQLQLFKKGEIRTKEEYNKRITSVKIDTSMNKAYLALEYLRKAQK